MEQSLLLSEGMAITATFLFAVVISYLAIPIISRASKKKRLFDQPDNDRKLHSEAIPTLGGIAIFLSFLLSFSLSPWAESFAGYSYLVGALLILFFVGLKDDLIVLSAKKKLIAQLSAAALVIFGSDILITDFHGVLGMADISYWMGIPITLFTVIVVINAVNLIDGIDGLAGGFGTIASLLFGAAFAYVGHLPMAAVSFCLAGALLGFLYYNFSPASIFMGDTGSMILGFLLAIQAIGFISLSNEPAFYSLFGNAAPILAVAVLALPLFDTLRVVLKRLRRSNSIFDAGQDHVHHELLRMGLSHKKASLLLYGKSLALVGIVTAFSLLNIGVNVLLGILLVSSLLVFPTNGAKRFVLAKLFGYNWQAYRKRKWGIELDYHNMTSFNGSSSDLDLDYENTNREGSEEFKDEVDSVAV